MKCELVREGLSARIDGESPGVPAAELDEHLAQCTACCAWYVRADLHATELAGLGRMPAPDLSAAILTGLGEAGSAESGRQRLLRRVRRHALSVGLALCGLAQLGVAVAQMLGVHFGMGHTGHGAAMSSHVMNETTAWALALGTCMVAAAWWRAARGGLLVVLGVFAVVLGSYVVRDWLESGVTGERIVSHLPVFVGLLFALALVRRPQSHDPERTALPEPDFATRPTLVQHDSAA